MRRQIVEVCRCYFANTADCNSYVSVRRTAQLLIKVNVRYLPEQLVLGTHITAPAAGSDLQMKMAKDIAVRSSKAALHKQRGSLQLISSG